MLLSAVTIVAALYSLQYIVSCLVLFYSCLKKTNYLFKIPFFPKRKSLMFLNFKYGLESGVVYHHLFYGLLQLHHSLQRKVDNIVAQQL